MSTIGQVNASLPFTIPLHVLQSAGQPAQRAAMIRRHAFATLDGLRGLAALVVLGRHVPDPTFKLLFPGGYLAVDFFFGLSGFVLAHAYVDRLKRGLTARRFMALRYLRILPQYLAATALAAALIAIGLLAGTSEASPDQWLAACLLAAVLLPLPPGMWSGGQALFPLNLPAWSLFFELIANATYCLGGYRLKLRGLATILGVTGSFLLVAAFSQGGLDGGGSWPTFGVGMTRILFSYTAGVAAHQLWMKGFRLPHLPASIPAGLLLAMLVIPGGSPMLRALVDVCAVSVVRTFGTTRGVD